MCGATGMSDAVSERAAAAAWPVAGRPTCRRAGRPSGSKECLLDVPGGADRRLVPQAEVEHGLAVREEDQRGRGDGGEGMNCPAGSCAARDAPDGQSLRQAITAAVAESGDRGQVRQVGAQVGQKVFVGPAPGVPPDRTPGRESTWTLTGPSILHRLRPFPDNVPTDRL